MKKIISIVLSAVMLIASASFAAAENDKVEISFKVGDSILSINGVDTEVETPYVAGEGVTLVPLRVITEAFGAQVDWEGETKTITLSYPDVNIVLQIDNIIAQVNSHNETLLEAPALSANGVTMVPLRFISETFGADVSYDGTDGSILVTKENIGNGQTVVGITDMTKTGDSYYKWSIDTPKQMSMTDRRLDGLSTEFTADDGSVMYIDIYTYDKDTMVSFDEEFSSVKASFSNYTLSEAEKLTDSSGHQYMHFQARNKEEIIDIREYYGDNYTEYDVLSFINVSEDTSIKDMILSIADSFKLGNIDNQTYDLSTVVNEGGYQLRVVKDDTYKVSFKIPADYTQSTMSDAENEFRFYSPEKDSTAYAALAIYSKSADVNAKSLAQKDHDMRVRDLNPAYSTVTDITEVNGGYKYSHTISGSSKSDNYMIDFFFDKGDYVYNISAGVKSEKDAALAEAIVSSIQAEELDSSKIGKLLRNDPDDTVLSSNTVGNFTFQLPTSWISMGGASLITGTSSSSFIDSKTGSMISVTANEDSSYTASGLSSLTNEFKQYVEKETKGKVIGNIEYDTINNERFAHFTYQMTDDNGGVSYATVYMKTYSKEMIMITLYERDMYYHANGNEVLNNMLSSLTRK